jgi:hypothetical protein
MKLIVIIYKRERPHPAALHCCSCKCHLVAILANLASYQYSNDGLQNSRQARANIYNNNIEPHIKIMSIVNEINCYYLQEREAAPSSLALLLMQMSFGGHFGQPGIILSA